MPCRSVKQCVGPCAGPFAAPVLPLSKLNTWVNGALTAATAALFRCVNRAGVPANVIVLPDGGADSTTISGMSLVVPICTADTVVRLPALATGAVGRPGVRRGV